MTYNTHITMTKKKILGISLGVIGIGALSTSFLIWHAHSVRKDAQNLYESQTAYHKPHGQRTGVPAYANGDTPTHQETAAVNTQVADPSADGTDSTGQQSADSTKHASSSSSQKNSEPSKQSLLNLQPLQAQIYKLLRKS